MKQGEDPKMPYPQCMKTYYEKTMMPKVPQSSGFTEAAASQCVTLKGVRQFGGHRGKETPTPLQRGGGGHPSPSLTQTRHLFRQAPSKHANTQS